MPDVINIYEEVSVVTGITEEVVEVILVAEQGPPGPPGAQGEPGETEAFVHTQGSSATEWVVNHNFGHKPTTEIYDNGGNVVEAQVLHMSDNQLRVYFSLAQAGFARCI